MTRVAGLIEAAATDRRHGAVEIERRLLKGLLNVAESWTPEELVRGAVELRDGQPAMANLRNLARWLNDHPLPALRERLELRARLLDDLGPQLAAAAWPMIEASRRLLTVSRSSAVAAVIAGARSRGWRGEVVVLDGSPAGRGQDLAADLAKIDVTVRSQPDAAAPRWLESEGVLVLVGADAVSPVRLVNACGTATLLELAAARAVPSVVAADTGKDLPDEEIDEILAAGPEAEEEGTGRRWPIFETAPMALVTRRINE